MTTHPLHPVASHQEENHQEVGSLQVAVAFLVASSLAFHHVPQGVHQGGNVEAFLGAWVCLGGQLLMILVVLHVGAAP
jgi:hypothetical protein